MIIFKMRQMYQNSSSQVHLNFLQIISYFPNNIYKVLLYLQDKIQFEFLYFLGKIPAKTVLLFNILQMTSLLQPNLILLLISSQYKSSYVYNFGLGITLKSIVNANLNLTPSIKQQQIVLA